MSFTPPKIHTIRRNFAWLWQIPEDALEATHTRAREPCRYRHIIASRLFLFYSPSSFRIRFLRVAQKSAALALSSLSTLIYSFCDIHYDNIKGFLNRVRLLHPLPPLLILVLYLPPIPQLILFLSFQKIERSNRFIIGRICNKEIYANE